MSSAQLERRWSGHSFGGRQVLFSVLRGRHQSDEHRLGNPALAADRPACYHRGAKRLAQNGATDGSTPQADRKAPEFVTERSRDDNGSWHPSTGDW